MKPKVTVVILTYNNAKTIEQCLIALEKQSVQEFEVLIIDDNSIDNTLNIINNYSLTSKYKIRILTSGKNIVPISRNIGIRNSKSDYVAFIDSDAYANEYWVENIINSLKSGKIVVVGGEIHPSSRNHVSKAIGLNDDSIRRLFTKDVQKLSSCNLAFNKKILKDYFFDERFIRSEDLEFAARIEKKVEWAFIPEIKILHDSRDTLKKYFKQMYKDGVWKVYFAFYTNKFRAIDFIPSFLILASLILPIFLFLFSFRAIDFIPSFFSSISLILFILAFLLIPIIFSLVESIFILIYRRPSMLLFPYIFISWVIKNYAFGLGTLIGILNISFNKRIRIRFNRI
jgi:glycosyltransferase involved in cell wall biosynthesis